MITKPAVSVLCLNLVSFTVITKTGYVNAMSGFGKLYYDNKDQLYVSAMSDSIWLASL